MSDRKSYLGDGVYVDVDAGGLVAATRRVIRGMTPEESDEWDAGVRYRRVDGVLVRQDPNASSELQQAVDELRNAYKPVRARLDPETRSVVDRFLYAFVNVARAGAGE